MSASPSLRRPAGSTRTATPGKPVVRRGGLGTPALMVLLCGGLLLLYAPTAWDLAHGLWLDDTHSHGPLVLAVAIWLFVRGIRAHRRDPAAPAPQPRPMLGGALLTLGLLAYVLGRSQGLYALEVGSAIPVLLGGMLALHGGALARRLWFAFVFLLFVVPLPGSLIDAITQPMKIAVSWGAEHLLHAAGYPVARAGVIVAIGPYQLLVADACAGLNSLFMLEAFGLLYLNVIRHESVLRNAVLAVLIVPISYAANVLRVLVLALVTFHYGDAAGQGFIHSFSGVVLFAVALVLTVLADSLVRVAVGRTTQPNAQPAVAARTAVPRSYALPMASAMAIAIAALLAAAAAPALTPMPQPAASVPDLEAAIPKQFGDWRMVETQYAQVDVVATEPGEASILRPYDQLVMRAYTNSSGQVVALAVAYGANQRQEVKIHRPELCYEAQGFHVAPLQLMSFGLLAGAVEPIAGKWMYAERPQGSEAVSYWIRIGDTYSDSAWTTRWHIFRRGLEGNTTDGVLVRASSVVADATAAQAAFPVLDEFMAALVSHSPPEARRLLVH